MSSNQTPGRAFVQVAADMNFDTFDMFTDNAYFDDDILPSADVPLPSVECSEDLPDDSFDSAFDFGFDTEGLHDDMLTWPVDDFEGGAEALPTAQVEMPTPPTQVTEVLPTSTSPLSSGAIESLWRPLLGSNSIKAALHDPPTPTPTSTKPRAPKAAPKAKVSKVKKTVKPAKVHKRTVPTTSGAPRSVQVLCTLPWSRLSQEEKGLLLLPLLQGIDPTSGQKMDEAGSLLPPPTFEMITDDVFGTGDDGANLMDKPSPLSTSSPAAKTTIDLTGDNIDVSDEDAAVFRACQAFNIQHDLEKKKKKKKNSIASLSDLNFDIPEFKFDEPSWDIFDNFMPGGQDLGEPSDKSVIGTSVQKPTRCNVSGNVNGTSYIPDMIGSGLGQMPTPSGDYGRKRQQEALKRNAMLQAAGRRR